MLLGQFYCCHWFPSSLALLLQLPCLPPQIKEPEKPLTVLLVTFPSSSPTGGASPPLSIPCFKWNWRETVQLDLFPGP